MRIRKSAFNSASLSSCVSPSCSSSSPSSISSSSSITNNSLASCTDSSSSFSSFSSNLTKRCQGLDLLVKAIHFVTAGSAVGVPYIQRRVIRRRRRALKFNRFIINQLVVLDEEKEQEEMRKRVQTQARSVLKRQNRGMALPSKYEDSVLHPRKPRTRVPRSIKICDGMGS